MSLVTGIDVSHWQTPSMQLANQRAAFGDRFAIVKSTDGTGNDKAFQAHVANFHAAGLAVGTYCFYRSHKDPAAQARATAEQMAGQPLTFGAWLDYEGGSLPDTPDDLLTFLSVLDAATTQTIGIYTGGPFWESTIGNDRRFARYPLWLARYPNRFKDASSYPTTISVPAPAPWADVALWQFSDGAGNLDRNVCTPETFAQITGNHPTPPHQEDDMTPAQEAKIDALDAKLDEALPILRRLDTDYLSKGKSVRQVILHIDETVKDLRAILPRKG